MNAPTPISEEMIDNRIAFERGIRYFPPATLTLLFLLIVSFGGQIWGNVWSLPKLIAAGALDPAAVMKGEVWRLGSCMYLHGSTDHFIGNAIVLYILGMGCEHAYGSTMTYGAYFTTGIAASILSCLDQSVSVGASGAIFGLLGLLGTTILVHQDRLKVRDNRTGVVLIIWAIYSIVTGAMNPLIDNLAHIGGLLAGTAFGFIFSPAILER